MVCCKMRAKVHIIIIRCNYFVRELSIFNIKTNLLKLEENR